MTARVLSWFRVWSARATVAVLLCLRDPSAIPRRVWTVVVNAVNRVEHRWAKTHIAHERCEVVSPCITHCDTTATIVRVVVIGLAIAAGLHVRPNPVLHRHAASLLSRFGNQAVFRSASVLHFAHVATATDRVAARERTSSYRFQIVAITPTQPEHYRVLVNDSVLLVESDETTETSIGQIVHFTHILTDFGAI